MGNAEHKNRIIVAAIKRDGIVFTGVRHGHIIRDMVDIGFLTDINNPVTYDEQGFVDSNGKYWRRSEALYIAIAAGQVKATHSRLYSEDLW